MVTVPHKTVGLEGMWEYKGVGLQRFTVHTCMYICTYMCVHMYIHVCTYVHTIIDYGMLIDLSCFVGNNKCFIVYWF